MISLNENNFTTTILASNKPAVVDFSAKWCGPCRMVTPILEELSKEYPNVVFGECDVDSNPTIVAKYGIRNIPAVFFFNAGKLVDKQLGSAPKGSFKQKIDTLL